MYNIYDIIFECIIYAEMYNIYVIIFEFLFSKINAMYGQEIMKYENVIIKFYL